MKNRLSCLEMGATTTLVLLLLSCSASHLLPPLTQETQSSVSPDRNGYAVSRRHPHRTELSTNAYSHKRESLQGSKNGISPSSLAFHRNSDNFGASRIMSTLQNPSKRVPAENGYLPNEMWEQTHDETRSSNTPFASEKSTDSASPFFVSIDTTRFYGGLVTFSHDLHPAQICRVMNGCIRNDDTLVLPEWMQRHDNTLKFQCGYPNIEFSLPDSEPPPALKNLDLIGLKSSRPSMPDFIRDFMPSAVIFDLVYGDHHVSKSCHSRKGKDCPSFPGLEEGFKPAVLLHPRLRKVELKHCWVRQFVALMKPPQTGTQAKVLYKDVSRSKRHEDLTCFRSVLFTRGPFNRNFIMDDHLRQIHFFVRHGITKKAKDIMPSTNSLSSSKLCSLNITISNRKRADGASNRLIGRYITNVRHVKDEILQRARRIPGLHINLASMTLEDKSLRWQINAMQKTDIWIAGHGPLLTNMIFLRENSTVIELQPFAYYPQTYERIAERLAHVSYERYIADPDIEAFNACVNQLYDTNHPAHRDISTLLGRYKKASEKYFGSDNTHSLILHTLKGDNLMLVKQCAQMQRLTTNARNFAIAVVRHARIRCGLPKPGLENVATKRHHAFQRMV